MCVTVLARLVRSSRTLFFHGDSDIHIMYICTYTDYRLTCAGVWVHAINVGRLASDNEAIATHAVHWGSYFSDQLEGAIGGTCVGLFFGCWVARDGGFGIGTGFFGVLG